MNTPHPPRPCRAAPAPVPGETVASAGPGDHARRARRMIAALVATLLAATAVQAQSRGELLYTTHCIACHTTDIHWRDRRAVNDWSSLVVEVGRWQSAAALAWSDDDVRDVARYLNEAIYRFPPPAEPKASLTPPPDEGRPSRPLPSSDGAPRR